MAQRVPTDPKTATRTGLGSSSGHDADPLDLCPSAIITLIANPERELTARLTDISVSALRLAGDQRLPSSELICVELSDYLILADVNQCEARGKTFLTDAARLVTLPKAGILDDASKSAKVDALIADFHNQCQLQLSTLQASIAVLDARAAAEPAGLAAPTVPMPDAAQIPAAKAPKNKSLSAKYVAVFTSSDTLSAPRLPSVDSVVANPKGPLRFSPNHTEEPNFEPKTVLRSAPSAARPETFADHMTVLGATPRRAKTRRWTTLFSLVAVAVISAGAAWLLWHPGKPSIAAVFPSNPTSSIQNPSSGSSVSKVAPEESSSDVKRQDDPPVSMAQAGSTDVATVQKAATQTSAWIQNAPRTTHTEAVESTDTAGSSLLHATLKAISPSWVAICYDGKERSEHLLAQGVTQEIAFAQSALVRLGNGPAVDITFEGKPIAGNSPTGVVRTIEFSAEGARFVNFSAGSEACGKNISASNTDSAAVIH